MINWVVVVAVFFAAMAGAIDGSARPGDGLRDIPRVFMRDPRTSLVSGFTASMVVAIVQALGA